MELGLRQSPPGERRGASAASLGTREPPPQGVGLADTRLCGAASLQQSVHD
jgi:hypothetical protein